MREQYTELTNGIEYRDIKGWPGYAIGSDGTVWSCKLRGKGGFTNKYHKLKTPLDKHGYPSVFLCNINIEKYCKVHRLVLNTFIGPRPEGMEACHNNGIRSDNRVENLRWDTKKGNMADKLKHGTIYRPSGELHPNSKLTENIVREARNLYAGGGWSFKKLGKRYGVSADCMWRAVKGECRWAHLA